MTDADRVRVWYAVDIASTLSRSPWEREAILARLRYLAAKWQVPFRDVAMWCRIAITGTTVSEPVDELLSVVDKEKALDAILRLAHPRLPGVLLGTDDGRGA